MGGEGSRVSVEIGRVGGYHAGSGSSVNRTSAGNDDTAGSDPRKKRQ